MSRKRLLLVVMIAAFALVLGTTDAEAKSRYGRRNYQQNGCRQGSNYGRVSKGYGQRYSGIGNQGSYNTINHRNYRYDAAGFGNYGHNNSGFQNYSPGNH